MSKISLSNLANLQNENTVVAAINANNAVLTSAYDITLSRNGATPNQMLAQLDMNSNRIINIPAALEGTDPVNLDQLNDALLAGVTITPMDTVILNGFGIFETRAAVASTIVAAQVNVIRTGGYATRGDGGNALYVRTASEPAHEGKVQSLDGAWWLLVAHPVNARMFGMHPSSSGATNSAAVNAACAYVNTFAGGNVFIPPGTYPVQGTITPNARTVIQGAGYGTHLSSQDAIAPVFHFTEGYIFLRDMQISQSGAVTRITGAGVKTTASGGGFEINNVQMTGMWIGVEVDGSLEWTISNTKIIVAKFAGIEIYNGADIICIKNVLVTSAVPAGHAGLYVHNAAGDVTVSDNSQFLGFTYGIQLATSSAFSGPTDVTSSRFSQVLCDQNTIALLIISDGGTASHSRTSFSQCDFTSSTQENIRIEAINGSRIDGMYFDQCHINFSGSHGVNVPEALAKNLTFTNCLMAGNAGHGVNLAAGISKVKLIGNTIGGGGSIIGNTLFGVKIDAGGGDYLTVIHNNLLDNVGGTISNGATGIHNVVTPNDIP